MTQVDIPGGRPLNVVMVPRWLVAIVAAAGISVIIGTFGWGIDTTTRMAVAESRIESLIFEIRALRQSIEDLRRELR